MTHWYPSANRDETVFADPFRFDVAPRPEPAPRVRPRAAPLPRRGARARRDPRRCSRRCSTASPGFELAGPVEWARSNKHTSIRHLPLRLVPVIGMHHDHLLPRHAYLKNDIPVAGVAHQAGTCRFGSDPATSVLNVDCRAHEVDNLYVVDTSFFPSIGAVNPALTAMANAVRVGDHLLERLGAPQRAEAARA